MWSASLAYRVEFDPDSLKDLKKLDRPVQQRLVGFRKTRVGTLDNPRDIGEALSGATLRHYWKCRAGDWRIICDIQGNRIVERVLRLGDRREAYR
jgi:mRNA interferase RelE/StbE